MKVKDAHRPVNTLTVYRSADRIFPSLWPSVLHTYIMWWSRRHALFWRRLLQISGERILSWVISWFSSKKIPRQ